MRFPTTQIPGGRKQALTPFGAKVYENDRELQTIEDETIEEMARRLGRQPTNAEMVSGPKPADDRTLEQKMERDSWRPKRTDNPDAMEALADELDSGTDEPDYRGLTLRQRLAADARMIAERNRNNNESDTQQAAKLKRLQPDLKKIDAAIDAENWRAERGSQRAVDLLSMLKEQLVNGNDATETRRLRQEVTNLLAERAKVEDTAKREAVRVLQAEIASINDGRNLTTLGESDPVRYRAEQLMAEGSDSTSAWTQARSEAG